MINPDIIINIIKIHQFELDRSYLKGSDLKEELII